VSQTRSERKTKTRCNPQGAPLEERATKRLQESELLLLRNQVGPDQKKGKGQTTCLENKERAEDLCEEKNRKNSLQERQRLREGEVTRGRDTHDGFMSGRGSNASPSPEAQISDDRNRTPLEGGALRQGALLEASEGRVPWRGDEGRRKRERTTKKK